MAIAIPHQPRYRDHSLPIYYLCGEQVRIRRRPTQIRDPRSEAQKAQRLRFKVASHFLAPFKSFVQKGFEPLEKENFRQVGAYQQALSHLLGYAIQQQGEVVKVDTQKVVLSEGRKNPMDTVCVAHVWFICGVGIRLFCILWVENRAVFAIIEIFSL